MTTPTNYYALSVKYEKLRALAFRLVMSEAVESLDDPRAQAVFDIVGDMTEQEVEDALRIAEEVA
jgi:hypothetical protein